MSKANAATGCLHTGTAEPHTCCAAGTDCDGGERRDHTCVGMTEPTSRQPTGCPLSCESNAFQGVSDLFDLKVEDLS